jgi:hypothetical protein
VGEGHGRDHAASATAEREGDGNLEHQMGQAHDQIDRPGDGPIRAAAQRSRGNPQEDSQDRAQQGRDEPHPQARPQAEKDAGDHVATEPVGSEEAAEAGMQMASVQARGKP